MKKILLILVFLIGIFVFVPSAQAQAGDGFTTITCTGGTFKQIDPILNDHPTEPTNPSAHLHEFAGGGATVVTASSTLESLKGTPTTCNVPSDQNLMWWPALIKNGQPVTGASPYRNIRQATRPETPHPQEGLAFIHGNFNSTSAISTTSTKIYTCKPGGTDSLTFPTSCPATATKIAVAKYNGQGCWDSSMGPGPGFGRTTGPADARSHMPLDGDCNPPLTKIPALSTVLEFPASAAGGYFSCDDHDQDGDGPNDGEANDPDGTMPGACLHVDFVYRDGTDANGKDFWDTINKECLNYNVDGDPEIEGANCGVDKNGIFRRLNSTGTTETLLTGRWSHAAPVAGFVYSPDEPASTDDVVFLNTGSCDGAPCTYSWRDNGVEFSTSPSPVHTFAAGSHTVALTVTDAGGFTDTDSQQIEIADPIPSSVVNLCGFESTGSVPAHLYKSADCSPPTGSWSTTPTIVARTEPAPSSVCDGTGETRLRRYSKTQQLTYSDEPTEQATLVAAGWVQGTAVACTMPPDTPGSVPLYRVTKANGDRVLTVNVSERDTLVAAGATSTTLRNLYRY